LTDAASHIGRDPVAHRVSSVCGAGWASRRPTWQMPAWAAQGRLPGCRSRQIDRRAW